uniref:Radical SAM core domain-containing protein n=1 Tax=Romanomermis culicivorax TaxID=13658 RepID=A0A915JM46_ROMCU
MYKVSEKFRRFALLMKYLRLSLINFSSDNIKVQQDICPVSTLFSDQLNELRNLKTIAMTSNGLILCRSLPHLVDAGLTHLNLSLDTLKEEKFEFMTRRKGWKNVWRCLEMSEHIFKPLKINCVVMKDLNDDELCDFVNLTEKRNLDVRFIEYMPFDGNKWNQSNLVPFKAMLSVITEKFGPLQSLSNGLNQTSKAYKVPNFLGRIGFITSMSDHFCMSCNRLRLTADGNLKVCLFGNNEVSLRDALRKHLPEKDLISLISDSVKRKHKQHAGTNVLNTIHKPAEFKISYSLDSN